MKPKKYFIFFFILFITCYCQSQNKKYGYSIPPTKVKIVFDSLYPKASNMGWGLRDTNQNIQSVSFDCNCSEGLGHLIITFDTNGAVLSKVIFINKSDLPANIQDYIQNNYTTGFKYGDISRLTTQNKEITYTVELLQVTPAGDAVSGGWRYFLKFKGTGEFISVEKR